MNGHNHIAHNLLTRLVLGASQSELQTAYDDDLPTQRAIPERDNEVVKRLYDEAFFLEKISEGNQYHNFLAFFEQQIEEKGWKVIVTEYVFSGSQIAETLLPLMYDGAYHSIIHLGFGIEFQQPSIIAEALAQAAAHQSFDTDWFFHNAESRALERAQAEGRATKTLLNLSQEIGASEAITRVSRTTELIGTMKQKRVMYPQVGEELLSLVSQWRGEPDTLELKTAEMISFVSYLSGASQRSGKARKIDFFFMHCTTSSIFFSVFNRQDWISPRTKARLVEWKGRLDLLWYATCGVPDLNADDIVNYRGQPSGDSDWDDLIRLVNEQHDDGHVAKFVRALRNGAEAATKFDNSKWSHCFPASGDLWLKIARMSYDTTLDLPGPAKWVMMAGLDKAWDNVPRQA